MKFLAFFLGLVLLVSQPASASSPVAFQAPAASAFAMADVLSDQHACDEKTACFAHAAHACGNCGLCVWVYHSRRLLNAQRCFSTSTALFGQRSQEKITKPPRL